MKRKLFSCQKSKSYNNYDRLKKKSLLTEDRMIIWQQPDVDANTIEMDRYRLMSPLTTVLERVLNRMLVNGWEDFKDSIL